MISLRDDATLLTVCGFDPATRAFQYDVNPYFGSSVATHTGGAFRAPFAVSIDVRLDVGRSRETQWLEELLRPGSGDSTLSAGEIRRRIARPTLSAYDVMLRLRSRLALDTAQVRRLSAMARRYSAFRDSVYDDLATYLASLHGDFDAPEARERWHGAIDAVTRASLAGAPVVRTMLSAEQYARIPLGLRQQLELTQYQVDRLLRGPQVGIAPRQYRPSHEAQASRGQRLPLLSRRSTG